MSRSWSPRSDAPYLSGGHSGARHGHRCRRFWVPGPDAVWWMLDAVTGLAMTTAVFAVVFRVIPDTDVRWRDTFIGGLLTAVLFTAGRLALAMYLGRSAGESAYEATGSVLALLLWLLLSATGAARRRVHVRLLRQTRTRNKLVRDFSRRLLRHRRIDHCRIARRRLLAFRPRLRRFAVAFFRQRPSFADVLGSPRFWRSVIHLRPVPVRRPLFMRRRIRTRMLWELRILRLWVLRLRCRHARLSYSRQTRKGPWRNPAPYVLGSGPPSAPPLISYEQVRCRTGIARGRSD